MRIKESVDQMHPLISDHYDVKKFRLKDTTYVTMLVDGFTFRYLLRSKRLERMVLDYGNNECLYLKQDVDRWLFEQKAVSFIHMTSWELFNFIEQNIPTMIYLHCKSCKDIPDEKDCLFQISNKDINIWRVTMTEAAYLAQGFSINE